MNFVKILIVILILFIVQLQYRLWIGEGNVRQLQKSQQQLDILKKEVAEKKERNDALYAEMLDLRKGGVAIEERARYELGMIRKMRLFFRLLNDFYSLE